MKLYNLITLITISGFTLLGCEFLNEKKDDQSNLLVGLVAIASRTNLEIPVELVAAGKSGVTCGNNAAAFANTTISGSSHFYLRDARVYIHGVKLISTDGVSVSANLIPDGKWQSSTVALLDFEDATGDCSTGTTEVNKSIRVNVPSGTYTGIEFTVGVPISENHIDDATALAPLNVASMNWNWKGGYKFMKIEWVTKDAASTNGTYHLGSLGCNGATNADASTSCTTPNRPTIRIINSGIWNPTSQAVYLDIQKLVDGTNSVSTGDGVLTCMAGNTDGANRCQKLISASGVNPSTGESSGTHSAFYIKP